MKTSKKILTSMGSKYFQQTNRFKNYSQKQRIQYIKQKFKQPRSGQYFLTKFPNYPSITQWSINNHQLSVYIWPPQKVKPKALIINYCALNSHMGLSGEMAQKFSRDGYVFAGYDYPNFGRSKGSDRGHIQSFDELIEISEQFMHKMKNLYQNIPIFIGGVSMGGLISFQLGLRIPQQINGCYFMNPAFMDNPANLPNIKNLIKRFGHFYPKFMLTKPIRNNSSVYSLQKYKLYDPYLYSGRTWISTSRNILKKMDQSSSKFQQFTLPYICIQGGTDKVVNPFTVFDFQEMNRSIDKQTIFIDKMWHALWFDDHRQQVINMTKEWIDQRI